MITSEKEKTLASLICEKALNAGFDQCGIVPLEAFSGYQEALRVRSEAFPDSKPLYAYLERLGNHPEAPWARSVVVCAYHYGKYAVPEELDRHIARYYLFDWHNRPDSEGFQAIMSFEEEMRKLGLTIARDDIFSIAPSRMAAEKAGLGRIRRNGFFYNGKGSWVWLETWLIDQSLETAALEPTEPPCPEGCRACIDACPTRALREPFMTDIGTCATRLTYTARDLDAPSLRECMGPWVYGCDACQKACPQNHLKWEQGGSRISAPLEPLRSLMKLEALAHMTDDTFRNTLRPHFRFVAPDNGWALRVNAVRAMGNSGEAHYRDTLRQLLTDADSRIAEMAQWSLKRLEALNDDQDHLRGTPQL